MTEPKDGDKAPMTPEQVKANVDAMGVLVDPDLAGEIPADSPVGYMKPVGDDALNEQGLPYWFPATSKSFEVTVDGESLETP